MKWKTATKLDYIQYTTLLTFIIYFVCYFSLVMWKNIKDENVDGNLLTQLKNDWSKEKKIDLMASLKVEMIDLKALHAT